MGRGTRLKKPPEDGPGLASVCAVLFHAFGWDKETVFALTPSEAELWVGCARAEQRNHAELNAFALREAAVDLLKDLGLVK